MLDKLSTQQRFFIAMLISICFIMFYDSFFIKKGVSDLNTTKVSQNEAPKVKAEENNFKTSSSSNIISLVKTKLFTAKIDEFGRISELELNDEKYIDNDKKAMLIKPSKSPLPLEIRFSNTELNEEAFKVPYKANFDQIDTVNNQKTLILTQTLSSLSVTKIITFLDNGSYDVKINLSKEADFFTTPGFRPDIQADGYTVHGVLLRKNDDSLEIIEDGDARGDEEFAEIDLLADSDRYYTTLLYDKNRKLNVYIRKDQNENTIAYIRSNLSLDLKGYIGPKDNKILNEISYELGEVKKGFFEKIMDYFKDKPYQSNTDLSDVIEYGWFTFIAKPMFALLDTIHDYVGNWGWAIVILTLLIRLVLARLTYKGMVSMNKMKDLAPKMKEIQEKYKGDPQKVNAHVMDLYRKTGVNPMGGCLPILIQIPIFFAIYRVLLNAIELKGAEWILWISDLAQKDPYFILPILMGITMFAQQHITPTTFSDPTQAKLMKWLPVIFVFFFLAFPAGLTLYWFINNICSLVQQYAVNKIFARQKEAQISEKKL